jgi:hypothetical protein
MKRMVPTAIAVKLSALLLAVAAPGVASAEDYAVADCSLQSNACFGDAGSSNGPVTMIWSFDTNTTDAIFPQDCTNQTVCQFWCPRYPGWITARILAFDANFNLVAASEIVPALCTQQDILLSGAVSPETAETER